MAMLEGMTMISNLMGQSGYRKQIIRSVEQMITDLF